MCTAVTYKTKDFYFGRTLDYNFSYGDEVTITPEDKVPCSSLLSIFRNTKIKEIIRSKVRERTDKKIIKKLEKVEEVLKDNKIEEIQSSVDEDAKQGYKSETNDFFGYKNHVAMTRERIVTALEITSGEAPDGKYLPELVAKSKKAGIEVKEVIGDKAYSGKDNLEYGKENDIKIISRINSVITNSQKNKEDGFEYIKDAETKVAHGLCKAKSKGLACMRIQSYLTHITTNLKRIIKKMDELPV